MIISRAAASSGWAAARDGADAVSLLRLFEQLIHAGSLDELERSYLDRVGGFVAMPMRALYLHDTSGRVERIAGENVSDYFLARYEEIGRAIDPLLRHAMSELAPADNAMLMTAEQWRNHTMVREVLRIHGMAYGLESPVLCQEQPLGTLAWGSDDRRGAPTPGERETAAALGRLVGLAVDIVRRRELANQSHDQLTAALDHLPTPVAITDGEGGRRHLNASAQALLGRVVDGDSWVDRLTARSGGAVPRRAEAEVRLVDGGRAPLHVRSHELDDLPSTTVSLLRLADATPSLAPVDLAQLTPREREIADLVSEALSDAEIAERLYLSSHTVRQHLKSIYRKLGVSSRVALTRLVLTAAGPRDGD